MSAIEYESIGLAEMNEGASEKRRTEGAEEQHNRNKMVRRSEAGINNATTRGIDVSRARKPPTLGAKRRRKSS
ncbi:DNA invertase [Anopheles sinensis]|uniref:DNA invertase n=1 Tax=Anopheles sinensis TaxID=74873 RepID=A0A084W3U8_ANOSI|nr:DNA invertase [Anopheles sinensis]